MLDTPGGRSTLILSSYVGLDLASTGYPKIYQEYQAPQKISGFFCNTKQYIHSVHLHLKKTLKYIKMTPKTNLICDFTKKYPQNFQNSKKIHFFWIPPPPQKKKEKWNSNLWTKKSSELTYVWIYQDTPPPPWARYLSLTWTTVAQLEVLFNIDRLWVTNFVLCFITALINLTRLFLCDDAVQRKRNLYASYI